MQTPMPSWRTLAPLLTAFGALSLLDWALTSWAAAAGWVRLDGTGWHEGNTAAVWLFTHGGAWAFLVYKLLLFGAILAIVVGLRWVPWRPAIWFTWGALSVAIVVQALATMSAALAVIAHRA